MRFLSTLLAAFVLGALIAGCSNEDEGAGEPVAADLSEERAMLAETEITVPE